VVNVHQDLRSVGDGASCRCHREALLASSASLLLRPGFVFHCANHAWRSQRYQELSRGSKGGLSGAFRAQPLVSVKCWRLESPPAGMEEVRAQAGRRAG
jgi:hypothetical protein